MNKEKPYKIYTYNNEFKNKVVFRSQHWINLIKNSPIYSQLFIEEDVDLEDLPSFPTAPPPAGFDNWDLWLIKIKEELKSSEEAKNLAELQLKQEKEKQELAEKQKKTELDLKDKEIKDLNSKIDQEKQNYLKLQENIKSSGSQAAQFQAIIDNQNERIRELEIDKKQIQKDLTKNDEYYNQLINRKDKELLIKKQEIETLKLAKKDTTADQQALIAKHQKDIADLQKLHQSELTQAKNLHELTLEKGRKVEKKIEKFVGIDYSTQELKVKLAGLKPWFLNANLNSVWDFIEEFYNKTFEIEEAIKGDTLASEEKTEWGKKIAIEWAKTNILVILNELKFIKKETVEKPFIKEIIRALKNSYFSTSEQLAELQNFIESKKKSLLNNPSLLEHLNKWEELEGKEKTKAIKPEEISLPSSRGTLTPKTPPLWEETFSGSFSQEVSKISQNLSQLFSEYTFISPFFYPSSEIDNLGIEKNIWEKEEIGDDSWLEYLENSLNVEELTARQEEILKIFGEVMIKHYLEQKDIKNIDLFKEKNPTIIYPSELDAEIEKLRKAKEDNKEEIKTQILMLLDGWKDSLKDFHTEEAQQERSEVEKTTRSLANNIDNLPSQVENLESLLGKHGHNYRNGTKFNKLLEEWKKLTNYEQQKWEVIHADFKDPSLIEKWETELRLNIDNAKVWVSIKGIQPANDTDFLFWLLKKQPDNSKNENNLTSLKKEFQESKTEEFVQQLEEDFTDFITLWDGTIKTKGVDNYFKELKAKLNNLGDLEQQKTKLENLLAGIKPGSGVNVEINLRYKQIQQKVKDLFGEKLTGKIIFQAREEPQFINNGHNRQIRINLKTGDNSLKSEGFKLKDTDYQILLFNFNEDKDDARYNFMETQLEGRIDVDITLNIVKADEIKYWAESGKKVIELKHDTFDIIKISPLPLNAYLNKVYKEAIIRDYIDNYGTINWALINNELNFYSPEEVKQGITRIIGFLEAKEFTETDKKERQHLALNELRKIIGLEEKDYEKPPITANWSEVLTEIKDWLTKNISPVVQQIEAIEKQEKHYRTESSKKIFKRNLISQEDKERIEKYEEEWLPKIREFGQDLKDKYNDPLKDLDLGKVASKKELLSMTDPAPDYAADWKGGGLLNVKKGLNKAQGVYEKYKNYRVIDTQGDGNCFLNAFSTLYTGKANDTTWALPLRVKLCLEMLTNPNMLTSERNWAFDLREIEQKLLRGYDNTYPMASNSAYMAADDISYFVGIIKRPIVMLQVNQDSNEFLKEVGYMGISSFGFGLDPRDPEIEYSEPFFIGHTGGNHFEAVIQPEKHQEGWIEFNTDLESEENLWKKTIFIYEDKKEILFLMKIRSLNYFGFDIQNKSRLENERLEETDRIIVRYGNNFDSSDKFETLKKMLYGEGGSLDIDKHGRSFLISIINASSLTKEVISDKGMEIRQLILTDNDYDGFDIKRLY